MTRSHESDPAAAAAPLVCCTTTTTHGGEPELACRPWWFRSVQAVRPADRRSSSHSRRRWGRVTTRLGWQLEPGRWCWYTNGRPKERVASRRYIYIRRPAHEPEEAGDGAAQGGYAHVTRWHGHASTVRGQAVMAQQVPFGRCCHVDVS